MLKIRIWSDEKSDVCTFLENIFQKDIEEWIQEQFDYLSFDSMDYPCDLLFCYDCYFICLKEEKQISLEIKKIWDNTGLEKENIFLEIYQINDKWEEQKI